MGSFVRTHKVAVYFCVGLALGFFAMSLTLYVQAAASVLTPSADGITNDGTQGGTCGNSSNYSCIDEATSTSSPPSGSDYVSQAANDNDNFQLGPTLTGVDTVSTVYVPVYHIEGGTNMTLSVSLWDVNETTQYGTTQNITNRTVATWDTATFSGLSLTQAQANGMRVRISCTKGGGKGTQCDTYALFARLVYTELIDVTVSSVGSQQNLEIGTTSAYVGGSFVISEDTGSRNLSSITITENGSIDAQNDLDNIKLYYEMAADCSAQTYNGTEDQYGSTDTNGFSGANGTSLFTETVAISTANDMCVYVVLDVGTGAVNTEDIEIEISNPSTDVVVTGTTSISPSTAVAISGTTNLESVDLNQVHYHWRDDSGDESGAASLTSGNEDETLNNAGIGSTYRVRMEVSNDGNITAPSTAFGLEYGIKSTECSAIGESSWVAVSATGGDWDMAGSGSGLSEGSNTIDIINGIGGVTNVGTTFVGTGGERETTGTTSAVALADTEFYEMEFAIVAQAGASPGTTYCFRVSDDGAPIDTYTNYPEATIAADITVSATSTPPATVNIVSTNIYGGGFAITDATAGPHDIESITITASGTIDLQNHVDNITLRYESDTTAPLDCTGESYSGGEALYGAVDTNGFSANGTSTFTPSIAPTIENSVNALCIYIEYDITASTTNGEKIEFRIADASTDVVVDVGSVSPAALVDIDGETTFVKSIVEQAHFHWRDNSGTESGANSATDGLEDVNYTELARETTVRLRFDIANTGGTTTGAYQYQLEWAQRITTCDVATGWVNVDTAADDWAMVASQLVDESNTTNIPLADGGVTNIGTFSGTNGQQETNDITGNITLAANTDVEIEYSIEATNVASEGTSYCFRLSNSGTELDNYLAYPEATIKLATDYKIQRGTTTIPSLSTTASISAGLDYEAPSSANNAFIRIINAHHTGRGPSAGTTGNHNAADVTAYISNPGNITSGITFTRQGTTNNTLIMWEIIEYVGAVGGENEMIVRGQGVATYVAANTAVTTGTISGVTTDADIVPFITGQGNPDGGRQDYNTGLSTSAWNAAGDTVTFTRGESGSDAVKVSYAVVEFTGSNWSIQRAQNTYTSAGVIETQSITPVDNISRAFIHAQHRAGSGQDQHADFGHEVWMDNTYGVSQVAFRINGAAQTANLHTSVAWIIENKQKVGDVMVVTRSNGSITGSGGGLTNSVQNIGKTVDDITTTGIFFSGSSGGNGRTFPEPMMSVQLISTTQYLIQVTDDSENMLYRTEVVEWPTAARKLIQDDFRFYVDNDLLTPTDPWSDEPGNNLGENAPMTANDGPISLGESVRIRMNLQVTAAAMPAGIDAFNLEYGENPGSCSAVTNWNLVGEIGSTTALFRFHNGAPTDGDSLPGTLLIASTLAEDYLESNPSSLTQNLALVGDYLEFDWNVEHNGADDKTDYCFRMVEGDRTPLESYSTYPIVRTVGYGPQIGSWRWYDDENNETPSTALANEDTAPINVAHDNIIKLRMVLAEKAGATGNNVKFALQFSEYSNFSQAVFDVVSSSTCAVLATTTSQLWCYADGVDDDNDIIQTALISDANSCVSGVGDGCGIHNEATTTTSTFDHTAYTNAEFEFTIKNHGARANAVYYFRLYDLVNDEIIIASTSYPSLMVEGAELTFTIGGLPSGTVTEGITTDVGTTPAGVNFGTLPLDTEIEAAHRLSVNTNATEGYQILTYARQNLLNTYGTAIDPITSTNLAPAAWATGCLISADGCFGYHVGDDILFGGSTRFSPIDSYAAFDTTPREVMYSSIPINESQDIVYKIQVGELQTAGDYETEIVYIAIPTF